MDEYGRIKSNIDKCTAREKYLIDIIEKQKEASNNGMKYGCHHLSCLIDCGHPCTCGFTEALVKWHEALTLTE